MTTSELSGTAASPARPTVCRWCRSTRGEVVLDLGEQPACDNFPLLGAPEPDPVFPLRLWVCDGCDLAQLADTSPAPEEQRGMELLAADRHAMESVAWVAELGWLPTGGVAVEFDSPHGGSWAAHLAEQGLKVTAAQDAKAGSAQVVIDVFGLMHADDQQEALTKELDLMHPDGTLVVVFPPLETVAAAGGWNTLRHGHFTYHSSAGLRRMLAEHGLFAAHSRFDELFGGTEVLVARRGCAPATEPSDLRPALRTMASELNQSVAELIAYLEQARSAGRRIVGYGAASRSVPLLVTAGVGPDLLPLIGDGSPAKHGRAVPGTRIPIVSPQELLAHQPEEVILFLPSLLDEVRSALPEVEDDGGRWTTVAPSLKAVPVLGRSSRESGL